MAQTSRVFDESPSAARGWRRLGDGSAAAHGVVGILVLLLCSNLALYGQAPAPATNTAPASAAPATNTPAPPSPDPAEEARAFEAARRAFQDGNHASAEKFFLEFRQRFPQSERFAEAMLYQARSLLRMERRDEAISLLGAAGKVGGRFEDEILYWHGEALQQKGDHLGAATQFARLLATQTNSARRLEAAYSEARAHFKLGAWKRVAELLGDGAGAFQQAARGRPADELASLGRLLLADALVQLRDFTSAESETRKLDSNALTPDLRWRKERLLYEVLALGGKFAEALVQSSNAVVAAVATVSPALSAEAVELQGTACQRMNRWDEAVAAFERNLADPAPAPRQRAALLQLVQIHLSRGQFQLATQRLDALVVRNPAGSPNDAALLAYGELFLRAHAISAQGGVVPLGLSKSNLLQEAAGRFDQVVRLQPASPLAGRAHLNLGWTSWAQERFPESVESFRMAATTLPFSEDQAVAVFKMGETLARMRDYTNAILTLQDFTNRFSALPRAANSLMDQALIHLVRLHSETRNLAAAQVALERLLAWSPESSLVDSSLLYLGNRLSLLDEPQQARALLSKVSDASPSKPVAELAVARTYGQQGLWTNAILGYSN
ncbi:MAG: tetratricopeptide repeat protein, partial [Verrucomicrobia bacterium]|nr:tetratricopeptide repeat protein [Verrucomicrobiota bacterium]